MTKKLFIETLGCAMNVRDSEHMIAELNREETYLLTKDAKEADLILINTCSVREKPVNKLFSEIGQFVKHKKHGAKIGVCGCSASHLGEEIFKRAPEVNFVLGARNVSKIREAVLKERFLSIDINYDESAYAFGEFRQNPYKAYINISIGCDKKCAFCIVPHTRGEEISVPHELILKEAARAAKSGAKEIFLLGQNVNNYGRRLSGGKRGEINFSQLLVKIAEIDEVERIRFTSPHPLHMDDEFLEVFASNPKICKSMHMPLQSGSTAILKAMRRGYTKEWFLERAKKLRAMSPQASISTDIIVAFPGESERDFMDTMEVMEEVRFEQIFSFKYSARPLTTAAQMTNTVNNKTASLRLKTLQDRHAGLLDEMTPNYKDRVFEVYFEELRENKMAAGRTSQNFTVCVEGGEELLGKIKNVKITRPQRLILYGQVV
ncbi:MAG: tRNA (N6-isopentenyl adenosine(37)-C2)-methylthiotransferase MiaB [Campylobacteraceae bacterium]|jgi:tRNA-2-methylthio-N6-dimethylallyladenosine synthase|nr:tRNA (N6-isopentenyl adenosine(37)-C2)-methylthiotransferase MiaB [Campylobacteraceae bacterium]